MNITDLSDTKVKFEMEYTGDWCPYWDYAFYAKVHDEHEYMQSMSKHEIECLRENCKKILLITDHIEV